MKQEKDSLIGERKICSFCLLNNNDIVITLSFSPSCIIYDSSNEFVFFFSFFRSPRQTSIYFNQILIETRGETGILSYTIDRSFPVVDENTFYSNVLHSNFLCFLVISLPTQKG